MDTLNNQSLVNDGKYKILKYLYENMNEEQYFRKIAKNTGLNTNNLKKHLDSLEKDKILIKTEKNNNSFYSYNLKNQTTLSVFSYVSYNNLNILENKRKNSVLEFIKDNRKESLFMVLFGSSAKGVYKKESDIDILVCVKKIAEVKNIDTKKYSALFGMKINLVVISLEEFKKGNDAIKYMIHSGYCIFGFENYFGELYD